MIFGVDYYPEHWEESLWEKDAKLMKEAGIDIVRIAEFGWSIIEKEEGKFDFSLFDNAINILAQQGIKVVLGTPSATPPAWISEKYPDIYNADENGIRAAFGSRRHYCFNHPEYPKHVEQIVEKLAQHYKDDINVLGYQIDNELGHEKSDKCYCPNCREQFAWWLKDKYGTLDNLNKIWGTVFWSQIYTNWSQIPLPSKTIVAHNPSMELDYRRFMSDSIIKFSDKQVDTLRKIAAERQFITHNTVTYATGWALDNEKLCNKLDFASFDNYPVWGGLKEPIPAAQIALQLDAVKGLKKQNFWVIEQLAGAQGHRVMGYLPRPGQMKLWSTQAMARGAEALVYFRWRACHFGAEQFCHGIIDHDNIPKRKYYELKEIISEFKKLGPDFDEAVANADTAFITNYDNVWAWQVQTLSSAFDYNNELLKFYQPMYNANVYTDVLSPKDDIRKYKLVVAPIMFLFDEINKDRITEYVENGGILVLSYRSGVKDINNNVNRTTLPCDFKELAGIRINEYESLQTDQTNDVQGIEGSLKGYNFKTSIWSDIIECDTAKPLAVYKGTFFEDKAAITVNNYGKGTVYYIGCSPDEKAMDLLYKDIFEDAKIKTIETEKDVEVVEKQTSKQKICFIMNHSAQQKNITIDGKKISLMPYESKIQSQEIKLIKSK